MTGIDPMAWATNNTTDDYDPFAFMNSPKPDQPNPVELEKRRHIRAIKASTIKMRATLWLWLEIMNGVNAANWLPLGGLSLLGGREGIGKSTVAYGIAAQVTRGTLPGCYYGKPRAVVISATEDAWAQTVVPRLAAAGADLELVYRVDAVSAEGFAGALMLPDDMVELRELCAEVDVALIMLDPLMGSISGRLDSHKDQEVRQALEPLSRLAHDTQSAILGLIHVNKSQGTDILTRLMASRAFSAVARAVLYCTREETAPDDDGAKPKQKTYLFGQAKNNLGPEVEYTRRYSIEYFSPGFDDELKKPIDSCRIVWHGRIDERIADIVSAQERPRHAERKTVGKTAERWLRDYLERHGPTPSRKVVDAAELEGFSERTIQRVSSRIAVITNIPGTKKQTEWSLPDPGVTGVTGVTDMSGATGATGGTSTERMSDASGVTGAKVLGREDAGVTRAQPLPA